MNMSARSNRGRFLVLILCLGGLSCSGSKQEADAGEDIGSDPDVDDEATPDDGTVQEDEVLVEPDAVDEIEEQEDDGTPPLPAGIYQLAGLDPETGYDDLAPLGDIVGEARVVAIGESSHASGGYLQARHRIIRYLVEELGFRAVAFETDWTEAALVAEYVDTCEGDPQEVVIQGMREIWHAPAVRDLVAWLCAFNEDHPGDPVTFFGFNNFNAWYDAPALVDFVGLVLPAEAARLSAGLNQCEGATSGTEEAYDASYPGTVDEANYTACIAALDEIDAYIEAHRAEVLALVSEEELEWTLIRLAGLRGFENYQRYEPLPLGLDGRDEAMAIIFEKIWQLEAPGTRVAIAAHSLHVNTNSEALECIYPEEAAALDYWEGCTRLGNHLAEDLGDDYLPISLVSYRTALYNFIVSPLPDDLPLPEGPSIVVVMLHELGRELLLVDLDFPGTATPLLEPGEAYRLVYPYSASIVGVFETVPRQQFRAMVYLEFSEPEEFF
jgi:erythromycin esterase-like protein